MSWRRRHPPGFPPPGRRLPLRPINPQLVEANRLFNQGDYEGSALAFELLAERALSIDLPRRPQILIQCGRAWVFAGNIEKGMDAFKRGLDILIEQKRWMDVRRFRGLIVEGLRRDHREKQAEEIEQYLSSLLGDQVIMLNNNTNRSLGGAVEKHSVLPLQCPYCGAPINSRVVQWIDQITAICDYCGNLIRGDER